MQNEGVKHAGQLPSAVEFTKLHQDQLLLCVNRFPTHLVQKKKKGQPITFENGPQPVGLAHYSFSEITCPEIDSFRHT